MISDEILLIQDVKAGNDKALEKLVKQNNGLIWIGVKKFLRNGYDKDDLYQIACIGFIKAVKRFDTNLSYKLSTFAVPYIIGELKRFFRDDGIIRVSRSVKSLGAKAKIESINYENEIEKIEIKDDEQNKIVDKLLIDDLIKNLNSREKKIINLRYFKGKTQTQVGKILGISQVQVSRIERKTLEKMRSEMI